MKVLFIGVYRDGTGWAKAAIDYILAMDAVGIDVACRPLKLNANNYPIPDKISELENKPSKGADICIQNVLPHYLDYNGYFDKNIALYFSETSSFHRSVWPQRINCMDEAWVPCEQMSEASMASGVTVPIKVIPCASDTTKFDPSRPVFEIPQLNDTFSFYFIGDMTRRKNLVALIKAFHLEFDISEPVSLLIKTTKYDSPPEETMEEVKGMCNKIKENLKIYPSLDKYKYEFIVTEHISEEEMYSLHTTCNCFVMPSYGEAWCIPAFEAMGFGNTPICSNVGGPSEYLKNGGGFLLPVRAEPVFGMMDTFNDIYTGHENWWSVDVLAMQQKMRTVFEMWKNDREGHLKIQQQGRLSAEQYSYENVGNMIKKELENAD